MDRQFIARYSNSYENFFTVADTHRGYGVDHAVGDLILPHVLYHIKLSCSLLWDDLVCDLLQFRVEFLKEIFKKQRQKLGRRERVAEDDKER